MIHQIVFVFCSSTCCSADGQ